MDLSFGLARLVGRVTFRVLRLRKSGATALPGLVALTIDPLFIAKAARTTRSIVITGTNGKTTTSNILAQIFQEAGWQFIHNMSGSNLQRGVASALLEHKRGEWAIFEADEADFSNIVRQVNPQMVVLLNLFRDQMDRYAEIDKTARLWRETLSSLPTTAAIICNSDDPALGAIGLALRQANKKVVFVGLSDKTLGTKEVEHTADSIVGPSGQKLDYSHVFYSHLGDYRDPGSDFKRPEPDYAITKVTLNGLEDTKLVVTNPDKTTLTFESQLPGVFNLYNSALAIAVAWELGLAASTVQRAVHNFRSVFGRFEKIILPNGQLVILFLIKNPVGFDRIIELLGHDAKKKDLLIAINDKLADGTDISWLWDANIESLMPTIKTVITSGTRAHEMALRLKYAQLPHTKMTVTNHIVTAFSHLEKNKQAEPYYCLLTYTALLEVHAYLAKRHIAQPFYLKRGSHA